VPANVTTSGPEQPVQRTLTSARRITPTIVIATMMRVASIPRVDLNVPVCLDTQRPVESVLQVCVLNTIKTRLLVSLYYDSIHSITFDAGNMYVPVLLIEKALL